MKLKRPLDYQVEKHLRHLIFAGRLVNEMDISNTSISEPVKYENQYVSEDLIFYVKCISHMPNSLQEYLMYQNKIFTGLTRLENNLRQILMKDPSFERVHFLDKKDRLTKILRDKLLLFQLIYPKSLGYKEELYLQLELVRIEDLKPDKEYTAIPSPKVNKNREEFEDVLKNGRPFTLAYYPSILPEPEFIYFDGYIYSTLNGELQFKSSPEEPTLYYATKPELIVRKKIDDFKELVQTNYDNQLFFLSDLQKLVELRDQLIEEGRLLEMTKINNSQYIHLQQSAEKEISASKEDGMNLFRDEKLESNFQNEELAFIKRFEENAFLHGLYYDFEDLVNFHVCMKTNLLTIIGGMSGTGKSKLAQVYAQTLGMNFDKEVLLIPISPSYREPLDVLGFLNPSTGVYHESETGLVSLLLEAERNPEKLFMVIFDEMNLSQVEHWFSPFISVLELDEDRRRLSLFGHRAYCVNERYSSSVKIGSNVLFVGTVNFDETTKGFSNRLLDRANVFFPKKLSFFELKQKISNRGVTVTLQDIENVRIPANEFRERWCVLVNPFDVLEDHELSFLDRLHELLNQNDSQRGISFRMLRDIALFLSNIPVDENGKPLLSREKAWDLQIQQRVLTKVRGMEAAVAPLVGIYQSDTYQDGQLAQLLKTEGQSVSTFDTSIATIQRKARELAVHGYAE